MAQNSKIEPIKIVRINLTIDSFPFQACKITFILQLRNKIESSLNLKYKNFGEQYRLFSQPSSNILNTQEKKNSILTS